MPTRRILLDTDIGSDVDDVLALGLVLASPDELTLETVTTVCGDTELRGRIACGLLGLAGRTDVDVCAGARIPVLRNENRLAWYGHEERCVVFGGSAVSAEPAAERIVRASKEVPDLDIVAIGPLTNIAHAIALDPDLPSRVRSLTIMGGHIDRVMIGTLECPHGIDYNMCSDPEATVAVLGAGFNTTLISADITLETWMNTRDLEALEQGGPLAKSLAEQVRIWSPVQRALFTGIGGTMAADNEAFLHDPLTVQALIDPKAMQFETLRIIPTIEGGVLRTRVAPEGSGLGAETRVATGVDARAAAGQIAARLRSL